jgi:acetolactate synthase-1/2/3 large subunit
MKTGAQLLFESLLEEGVDTVFGIPGGAVLPVYDTMVRYPIRHILMRHEQNAAHAADGYARVSGKVGVCFATSGPGVTNLVTGIATAQADSSPLVAITGQVSKPLIGRDSFQEVDTTGITLPITKHNYLVLRPEDIPYAVHDAFRIARSGRPGPTLIDIPKDVQLAEADEKAPPSYHLRPNKPAKQTKENLSDLDLAIKMLRESRQPVIIAGHGVILSAAYAELRELAERLDVPVVTTLLGVSSFPESHELSLGMLGMHGTGYANQATCHADVILAVGMRFGDRATGLPNRFAPTAGVIHVDIEPAEIGKNVATRVCLVGDAKKVLSRLAESLQKAQHSEWLSQIAEWRAMLPSLILPNCEGLPPQYVMRALHSATNGDAIIVADVGQNQMWAAQYFTYDRPNSYLTSGGLGTMGFALPAALGAKVADPDATVWAVCGDGGFQMTQQELSTLVQDNIPVKIAILNNGFLGMVRQWQHLFHEGRYVATPLIGPDFARLAEAHGVMGIRVDDRSQVDDAIERALAYPGPALIDFHVVREENVYPMVVPGASLAEVLYRQDTTAEVKELKP